MDVSRETQDVTTKPKRYDLANVLAREAGARETVARQAAGDDSEAMAGKAHYIEAFLRIDIDGSGGRQPPHMFDIDDKCLI